MSKIYEALLRAEQDRATQEKESATGVSTSAPTAVVVAPIQQPPQQQPVPVAYATPAYTPPAAVEAAPAPATRAAVYSAAIAGQSASFVDEPSIASPQAPAHAAAIANGTAPASPGTPSDDRSFSPDKIQHYRWSPSLDTLPALEDRGAAVEQFRSLRSRMFEFRDLNKLKSVMVSSGLPQEGKSFVATNLAISFARHKSARVLLIDGDMRRSTLHKLLGATPDVGLAEYLAGTAGLLDVMQQMQLTEEDSPLLHGLASLTFIPGGSDADKAADLSGNHRFAQMIAAVSPFYDWIVVDSAPVNVVADGVNLARSCDGVLLVARGGVTKYEVAQRALMELKASNILGFVLNAVENLPLTGGYYGYESYDSPQK